MPTYQYVCTECGEPLEAVQRFTDAALTECPACGGRLRKVFGSVGVVFKGSGFYKTDSRAKTAAGAGAKAEPAKADAAAAETTAGSTSGDATKPASAPAPEKATAGSGAAKSESAA